MEVYRVSPGDAIADLLAALRQRGFEPDLVLDTIQFLQQWIRLLEQQLYDTEQRLNDAEQRLHDAERMNEDRDQTNDRQRREFENLRRQALKFDDDAPIEDIAQALEEYALRRATRARRERLADRILQPF